MRLPAIAFLGLAACSSCSGNSDEPDAGSLRASDARPLEGGDRGGKDAVADKVRSDCPVKSANAVPAGAAASAGFDDGQSAYFSLYDVTCQGAGDCANACIKAGGTSKSCTQGSACPEDADGPKTCLPPTYWLSASEALSESDTTTHAAELILVDDPYDDALQLTRFAVVVPDDATITGIQFQVRRNADDGFAVDDSVRVMQQDGKPTGTEHAVKDAWPLELAYENYGGAYDTWGEDWTVDAVRSKGFGISIAPRYSGPSAGNDRAHVDSVRVVVYYVTPCD